MRKPVQVQEDDKDEEQDEDLPALDVWGGQIYAAGFTV